MPTTKTISTVEDISYLHAIARRLSHPADSAALPALFQALHRAQKTALHHWPGVGEAGEPDTPTPAADDLTSPPDLPKLLMRSVIRDYLVDLRLALENTCGPDGTSCLSLEHRLRLYLYAERPALDRLAGLAHAHRGPVAEWR